MQVSKAVMNFFQYAADRSQLYRDGKRVLECLQRALRVADACMDTAVSVELFVEILNRYVYYFDQQNETVRIIPDRNQCELNFRC